MAGGQERILRRRIRSVQATKKITRAMELIAASRIVRAQQRVQAAMPYSETITEVVRDLAAVGGEVKSPLLQARDKVTRACKVVIVADRGLCGGYNSSVIRAAEGEIKQDALEGIDYALVLLGRKAESYFRFRGYHVDATFGGFSDNPTYADAQRVAEQVVAMYQAGEVDRVELIYTRFISAGFQEVVVRPLVPLEREVVSGGTAHGTLHGSDGGRGEVRTDGRHGDSHAAGGSSAGPTADYEYEPAPNAILETLLPRYVEARVYAALLNAAASEHAARQRAMKAATDNAEELIKSLSRVMNRARQDSITTEIMEIVGGAEALRSGGGGESASPQAAMATEGGTGDGGTAVALAERAAPAVTLDPSVPDDLLDIDGIGPKINAELQAMGITTFKQLATLTPEQIEAIYVEIEHFRGRIEREDWMGQARDFHFRKYGERL